MILEYQTSQTDTQDISGPTWKVSVRPYNKIVENTMIEFLANRHDKDLQALQDEYSNWKSDIQNNLSLHGAVNILNFGVYTKNTNHFTINPEIVNLLDRMNPTVSLSRKPASTNFSHSQKVITKVVENDSKKNQTANTKLLILALLIIGFIVISYALTTYLNFNKYNSITEIPVHINKKPSSDSHNIAYETEFDVDSRTTEDDSMVVKEIGEHRKENSVIPDNYANDIQESENCTIIVGSFKTLGGLERMENKVIQDTNYTVIKMQYGEFTRIGFEIPCDENVIDDIKNTYNSSAWLLE